MRWDYGARMALFPPGKEGGESVARGGKGKGILIHSLTEGHGVPLANRTTPANGDEAPRFYRCWTPSRSVPANRGVLAKGSKSSRQIRAMMRKHCGKSYGPMAFECSSRNASGRPRKTGADQSKSRVMFPSGADICLVPEEVSPLDGSLGAHCVVLRGVPGDRYDPHLAP
jgi:hypothetical protein